MLTKFHLLLKNWASNFQAQEKETRLPNKNHTWQENALSFNSIKYLGVKIDENPNWKDHIQDIATKLNRANAPLFKIRNYVKFNTLESIYFAIFDSRINYAKP